MTERKEKQEHLFCPYCDEEIMADQSLDCIGLYCPMPIVKTAERIKQLKQGEVLEVMADDKGT